MNNKLAHSAILGGKILEALGLDPMVWAVTRITIDLRDGVPAIDLRRLLRDDDGMRLVETIERYELELGRQLD